MSHKTQDFLKALGYFPAIGFLTKFIIDAVTSNGMSATSSIIQNSCIILYLAYVFWFLITQPLRSNVAIFIIFVLMLVYVTSIVMNASYMNIINRNVIDLMPDVYWVFFEIIILYKFMSIYISESDANLTLVLFLAIIVIAHATTIVSNYVTLTKKPTDEAKKPITPIVTPIGTD
jgi:hypothetical protein